VAAEAATDELASLFESAPAFLARLRRLPADERLARAERIALNMPEAEQVELLNAHPRIGAPPAAVSALSYREQGYDHHPGNADLAARLELLNDEYEARFGFRFVIFVGGRSRSEIADVLESKLAARRAAEKRRGLLDVVAIARDRARHLAAEEGA
jgi:2-oxo-4-hydroxy-4-carboxy--5-ureidoimidazoline (OHCU) decarboxylase